MERQWRIGEDLLTSDSLLDGITFDDIILQIHCNIPKHKMTPDVVMRELKSLLNSRVADMMFLAENNLDKIIEYAMK